MATLQKFKLFATQCGVAPSPTRSPRTSPLVQLRRRKTTLRMLLGRSSGRRSPRRREHLLDAAENKGKDLMRRHSLKDLFVSSPNEEEEEIHTTDTELGSVAVAVGVGVGLGNMGLGGSVTWRDGSGSPKPVWMGFRCRSLLKRKAWRPVLLTIPE